MPYDLRPLTLAELLDRAFSLYRRHFWLFVGIMALPSLAMLIVSLVPQFIQGALELPTDQQPLPEVPVAMIVTMAVAWVFAFIVYWISYVVALGATTVAVSGIYADRTPTIADSYRGTSGKVGRLVLLWILIGIRALGVFVVLMLGGGIGAGLGAIAHPIVAGMAVVLTMFVGFGLMVWMLLRYAVSVPVAVLEDHSASDAIARSIELTRGSLLRVFVLMIFTVVVTYAALFLFQAPFIVAAMVAGPETAAGFWLNLVGVVTGSIGSALTGPLAVVAMAVLYYDLRIRNEGLDVELLVARLGQGAPAQSGPSSAVLPG